MKEIFESIQTAQMSKKVAPFLKGVDVNVEKLGRLHFRAEAPIRIIRAQGYRFSPVSFMTKVIASNGVEASGFGEGSSDLITLQKSVVEGIERVIFSLMKRLDTSILSSNGWAAHGSVEKANRSALLELLERDAALTHWLTETALYEVDPATFPKQISDWAKTDLVFAPRFKRLRILVSSLGHIPSVTTVLCDPDGFAVLSHATANTLDAAISKALAETCRIAELSGVLSASSSGELSTPEDHAMAYTQSLPLPSFVFGKSESFSTLSLIWQKRMNSFSPKALKLKFLNISCGPLVIARATSPDVQDLFFGETVTAQKNEWINVHRLTEVKGFLKLNPLPHFVP